MLTIIEISKSKQLLKVGSLLNIVVIGEYPK